MRSKHLAAATAALWLCAPALAAAQQAAQLSTAPIAIKDIKAQLFLEKSATFSDNIANVRTEFENAPRGEGGLPEPATGLLVTLEFTGAKGTISSNKISAHVAQVILTRKYKAGPKTEQRVFSGFRFTDAGNAYKAFMVDAATCAPLEIDVRIGRSRKTAKLEFSCTSEEG